MQVVEPEKIILELSLQEANTLGAMLGSINRDLMLGLVSDHGQLNFRILADEVDHHFHFNLYNALNVAVNNKK